MKTKQAGRLSRWPALALALFALACAFLAPVPEGAGGALARARTGGRRAGPQRQRQRQEASPEEPPADSTVSGRVVYDDTNRPVRRARVRFFSQDGTRLEQSALTDARGEFRLEGVRAGSYFVFPDVPGVLSPVGFVSLTDMRSGTPDFTEARKFFEPVEVDGRQDVRVTVRARRGGALSGKVAYADGDPAVHVTVNLMRRGAGGRLMHYVPGANLLSISALRTDDRGVFRVTGLPPGEYLVAVTEAVEHGEPQGDGRGDDATAIISGMTRQQLLLTYYPSALSAKEAAVVKIGAGDERADLDITIPERALRTVAGVVRARRDKRPVARARVAITRREGSGAASEGPSLFYIEGEAGANVTTADDQGRWAFSEIPEGAYTIVVRPPEEYEAGAADTRNYNSNMSADSAAKTSSYRPPRRRRVYAPAQRDVEVSGGDMTDVAVEVADGARISGTIKAEGDRLPRYVYVHAFRFGAEAGAVDGGRAQSATVEDGRFTVEGLTAGKFGLHPDIYDGEMKLYVKSMTWKGRDLLREPLTLAEGESAEGVEITFALNAAELRVRVTGPDGKRAPNTVVFLAPAGDPDSSPYTQTLACPTGEAGFCSIAAPPGEYQVCTVPFTASLRRPSGGEAPRPVANGPRVSLRAGETKDLTLAVPEK